MARHKRKRTCLMIRTILRRMTGRNGVHDMTRRSPTTLDAQRVKAAVAASKAADARRAVDSFTASLEQAMRGQVRGRG